VAFTILSIVITVFEPVNPNKSLDIVLTSIHYPTFMKYKNIYKLKHLPLLIFMFIPRKLSQGISYTMRKLNASNWLNKPLYKDKDNE
jgi:hypothetical protein